MTWQQMMTALSIGLAGGIVSGFFGIGGAIVIVPALTFFHGHGPTQSPRHFFGFTPLAGRVFGLLGILSQWQRRCSVGVVNCVWVVCWSVFGCLLCTMAAITGHAKIFRRFLDSDWAENVVAVRALR